MANISQTQLSPEELKEVQDFLKSKNVDIQFNVSPQKVRRMEDGGLVIDPPAFTAQLIKKVEDKSNHKIDVS